MKILVILTLLSIIPSFILGTIVYNNDRVEKEPLGLLMKLFICGSLVIVYTFIVTAFLEIFYPFFASDINLLDDFDLFVYLLLGVALVEESGKWLVFKKLAWNNKEFNYIYDAIVYSAFISLGFATVENLLYVVEGGLWVAIARAICSVPGHVFFGIYMGYYFGLAKQAEINGNIKIKKNKLRKSIIVPTLLHTFFNFFLFSDNGFLMIVYAIFLITLYIKSFKKIKALGKISVEMTN